MDSKRLTKIGEIAETPDGKKALVNKEGTAYLVQESVILVWDAFDGKTPDEVAEKFATMVGEAAEDLKRPVNEVAEGLVDAGLLIPAEIER